MSGELKPDALDAVLKALGNPTYKWRTVEGLATETGLDTKAVMGALATASDRIVKSTISDPDAKDVFTTRARFREEASLGEKLFGAIKNRAV